MTFFRPLRPISSSMLPDAKRPCAGGGRASSARRQRGRSAGSLVALLLVVAVVLAGGWWWKNHSAQQTAASAPSTGAGAGAGPGGASGAGGGRRGGGPPHNQPVSVKQASKQDIRVIVNAIGNVVALNTAAVHTRVDGLITSISIREGQHVQAGQVLMQLDPSTYKASYDSAQGTLMRDQAQLDGAKVDLVRYQGLLAKDSIQSQQVDTQAALVKQLTGTVKADQAAVETAKLNLDWCTVRAPITGRLGLRTYDVGNMVHAADPGGIVTITQTQPIAATFTVPEMNLSQIMAQVGKGATMPVEAWDREQKHRLALGTLLATDNAVDPTTGTIRMKAMFPNKDEVLFPNQFVNIRMQVDTIKDATAVPTNAIQRGAIGTFVYVVGADHKVTMHKIKMGVTDGDWVQVTGDVNPGDTVVTDGADRLRDGAAVDVIVPQVAGAASAPGGWSGHHHGAAAGASAPVSGGAAQTGGAVPAAGASMGSPAAAMAATGAAAVGGTATASAGDRPRWMDFLPPNTSPVEIERIKAMSQDDRRAYIKKLREQQAQ